MSDVISEAVFGPISLKFSLETRLESEPDIFYVYIVEDS